MADEYYDLPPTTYDQASPGTNDYAIVQWCEDRLKRGIKFVESQIGYDKIDFAINEIFAYERTSASSYIPINPSRLSQTRANLTAKTAEDLTAMLTDIRHFWNYSTNNSKYEAQCRLANKGGERWYSANNIDLRVGDVIRYYTYAGTGIAHFYYCRRIDDFMLEAEDPRNVFPIDPMSYHSFEDCLGGIVRRPRTPEWVREEYGKSVPPDSSPTGTFFGWLRRVIDGPGERGGPLSKRSKADQEIPSTPTVFVNTMYLKDRRTNRTGKAVQMGPWKDGRPTSPWSYEVPPGAPLYPFNRLIAWGGGALLHDGPCPYWHARMPLLKLTLNPWPGSWFGKAPLWDCLPLQNSINGNLRVIDDHAAQIAQPHLVADRNVSKAEMAKANTRAAGMKIKTNMASGKGIQFVAPPPLEPLIWEVIKWCEEKMQKIAGTADISAVASLAQLPSDDTIDTIMKAMTPGLRLRSRILEGFYKELAYQYLFNFWEWDSLPKRIAMFGPQSATKEDFDYDPKTGIPDDIPDGEPGDIAQTENALGTDNPRPLYVRAKAMLKGFECKFDPSSLLNTAGQQELMKYFMLAKMGYCSVFTLMEKMGITGFAPPDLVVPADEINRLKLQQALGIGMLANSQGRKASDEKPPDMGQNADGPTITTS